MEVVQGAAFHPPPPTPPIVLKDQIYPNKLYIIGKGIYRRVRFILDIDKIFWFRDFMSNFREMTPQWLQKKFQTFKIMNILYIILKHMVWRFRQYKLFPEIFKFCGNMSKNRFREIL